MEKYGQFAGVDKEFAGWDASEIAVLPVPYDRTSTWIKGADKGPLRLFEASCALEWYDMETDTEVYRRGIYSCPPLVTDASAEQMVKEVEGKVGGLLSAGKFVVTVGGEHSVSIGAVRAHNSMYGNMSVLHLDAHSDLRDEYNGTSYNHACVVSRIREINPVVQAGVRSMCAEEKERVEPGNIFYARDIVDNDAWMDQVAGRLTGHVYVTIDLDVFDPGIRY